MIEPARPEDEPFIVKLITDILSKEFPQDQSAYAADDLKNLSETYSSPSSTFLVAKLEGQVVGTCGVKADSPQTAILRRLFVSPSFREQGVATSLLKEALRFCRAEGFQEVVIRTSSRMEQAIRLCQSLGFKEEGLWEMGPVTLVRFRLRLAG